MQGRPHTPVQLKEESISRSKERKQLAENKREQERNELKKLRLQAHELSTALGLNFIHLRRECVSDKNPFGLNPTGYESKGGITLAFKEHSKSIDIAINKCSDLDHFSAAKGRYLAAQAFKNGEYITIPRVKGLDTESMLYGMFKWCILTHEQVKEFKQLEYKTRVRERLNSLRVGYRA